ncbi:MAG: hypothetical protein HYV52_03185 [Parcubacteria group bacterium]|nr:hypothetical protein [Parcubacteria group bacterium]
MEQFPFPQPNIGEPEKKEENLEPKPGFLETAEEKVTRQFKEEEAEKTAEEKRVVEEGEKKPSGPEMKEEKKPEEKQEPGVSEEVKKSIEQAYGIDKGEMEKPEKSETEKVEGKKPEAKAPRGWSIQEIIDKTRGYDVLREEMMKERKERMEKAKKEKYAEPLSKVEKAGIGALQKFGFGEAGAKAIYQVGKGGLNTIGSIFGARLAWEAPKLIYDHYKKKGQKEKLSDLTTTLLENAQFNKKVKIEKGQALTEKQKAEREKLEAKAGAERPVLAAIKELNAKLKEAKMPPEEKKKMRSELAVILQEYKHKGKDLEKAKTEKTGKLLDLYINNSAQKMVVAREAVNTLSIATFTPWLRTVGYAAFAGLEKVTKAGQNYEKKHFKETEGWRKDFGKFGAVAKNLTIDSARETFNGLTFNYFNKEKKGKIQTGAEFASSMFMLMRVVGLYEFEKAMQSGSLPIQEGAKKFWENFEKGDLEGALRQGGENMLANAQRLLSHVGLAENPDQAMKKLMEGGRPQGKGLFETIQEERKGEKQEGLGAVILEKAKGEYRERLGKEIALAGLATIHQGEGIEHGLIRQLEFDPAAHGFKGDSNNFVEVHRWAQGEAHKIAVENNFINPATGEETRVIFDAKHPAEYILKPEGSVDVVNRNEYSWKPAEETKKVLENARNLSIKTPEELMKENLELQAMREESQKILDYKIQHDAWGKSDEEVKDLIKLKEMQETMTMTEGSEKGMEMPPELRGESIPQSVEQPRVGESTPSYSKEEFASEGSEKGMENPPEFRKESDVFQREYGPKAEVQPEMTSEEKLKEMQETMTMTEGSEKGMEMPPELREEKVVLTAPEAEKLKEELKLEEERMEPVQESTIFKEEAPSQAEIQPEPSEMEKAIKMEKEKGASEFSVNVPGEEREIPPITELEKERLRETVNIPGEERASAVKPEEIEKAAEEFKGLGKEVLKENWRQDVMNKLAGKGNTNLHLSRIENAALKVIGYKNDLALLEKGGRGSGPEAESLKKMIKNTVDKIEKQYGDVFK